MVTILGAGIAGLSAAHHLALAGEKPIVYEQGTTWGGHCKNFSVGDFRFDEGIHLSFTKDEYVRQLFHSSSAYLSHEPVIGCLYGDLWINHPIQYNLGPLPVDMKIKIIEDFVANTPSKSEPRNYGEWLRAQFGAYFAETFPFVYTRKYWTVEAEALSTSWIGPRVSRPSLAELLRGAFGDSTGNHYYADEMRYPEQGGFRSFLNTLHEESDVRLEKKVECVNTSEAAVYFADGSQETYDTLISSLPLPELIAAVDDVPRAVREAAESLTATSLAIVSLGFSVDIEPRYLWHYIYDEEFLPARCYSPGLKSPDNVPEGCSSLQFETYFSRHRPLPMNEDELLDHVIRGGEERGLFAASQIVASDVRTVPYANVLFDLGMEERRQVVLDYLDGLDIHCIGRFGCWDYLWSDQALLTGKQVAEKLIAKRHAM